MIFLDNGFIVKQCPHIGKLYRNSVIYYPRNSNVGYPLKQQLCLVKKS